MRGALMRTFIEHRYREIDTRLTILTIQARAYLSLAGVLSLEYVLSGGAGQFADASHVLEKW